MVIKYVCKVSEYGQLCISSALNLKRINTLPYYKGFFGVRCSIRASLKLKTKAQSLLLFILEIT